jgi:hypothetical protein
LTDQQHTTNELHLRAVAEDVAALLSEQAEHQRRVEQMLARAQLVRNRAVSTERRQNTRRKTIVGGALLAEVRTNPEFRTLLYEILARRVADPRDRALIAGSYDNESDAASITLPVSAALPSPAEFAALAQARLASARSPDEAG